MNKYYTPVYRHFKTENCDGVELIRIMLNEGINLYEIQASYAKNIPYTTYYCLGSDKAEVKKRFLNILPYMKISSIRLIENKDEEEKILSDINKIPL